MVVPISFSRAFLFSFALFIIFKLPAQQKSSELSRLLDQSLTNQDNGKIAFYSYELGKISIDQGDYSQAEKYLDQAVTYGRKANDDILIYLSYERTGFLQTTQKKYNKALDSYQRSLKVGQQLSKNEFIKEAQVNIATSYALQDKHKRSIKPLEEALSIAVQENDVLFQGHCYELLSEYHQKIGNQSKSKEYSILLDNLIKAREKEVYSEKKEQEVKALEKTIERSGKEKITTRNQLSQQSQKLRLIEDSLLATKYFLEEKEDSLKLIEEASKRQQLEIDLLNKDKELATLKIKEQEASIKNEILIRNGIIIGALLVVALISVVIIDYRKKIKANRKIDLQNKSIQSSINYAKRIQEAMLTKDHLREKALPDSFILFKPRDTVSGDFYWFSEIKSWYNPDIVMAAVDCTGHGIPGAFMSMIGINSLNGIVAGGIAESDQILNSLDKEIRNALQQETSGNNDGMDVALCIYRKEKNILEFSGAKNPLVYIQDQKLHRVKGDPHSIGGSHKKGVTEFKKHLITIEVPTMVYLFSDGYRDQFGGKQNLKFMSKRFNELLLEIHQEPVEKQKEILDTTITQWMSGHHQTDDILVMGIKLEPGLIE